ncbi:MAG: type VI secretion system baseplate subunit TssK [Bryobacteraceae bacterium]
MPQIPDAIQWHEGMLLMPQHFQQMATRYEGLIQSAVASASPYAWGLLRFEYDRSALVGGMLRVLQLEAIMKDGLAIRAGSEMGVDLDINLKGFADQMRAAPVTIYLTVPAQRTLSTRGDLARYISHEGEAVPDEATGEDAVSIPTLRPRVALWAGDLPPARYDSLPLMRVQAQNEAFQEHEYVPACLTVSLVSGLGKACSESLAAVRAKSYVLADELRSQSLQKGELGAADVRTKVLALATGLPGPEAVLHSERSHPFTLYLLMCQLAGHMASITSGMVPPQFPPYRHEDLSRTFEPVLGFIRLAAAEALVESWTTVPFRAVDGRFEAGPSSAVDQALAANTTLDFPAIVLGLRAAPGVPTEAVLRWGEGSVIATTSLMPTLLSNRVSGAQRKRVEHLPGLVQQRGMVLLALLFEESAAKAGEAIQIIERFMNEGRPEEAVLYIRRSEPLGRKD